MSESGLPLGGEKRAAVRSMFDAIAPRYDAVNKAMSFGLDVHWRRRTVRLLGLPARSSVLDVACGTGDLVRELCRSHHTATGIDLSAGMLAHARVAGAPLIHCDAAAMPFAADSFDGAVSGFALRNFSDLPAVLDELARVVRRGGRLALLDVSEPEGSVLKLGHSIWFNRAVPRLGALVSDAEAYSYLPRSVAYLPPPGELVSMLVAAGFKDARRHVCSGGIVQVLTGTLES